MIRSIGVIGAGSMGSRMARRVRAAGFDLTICDPNPDVQATFRSEGVPIATHPGALTDTDAVIVLVASDAQIDDVLFGDNGLVNGSTTGRRPLVAIMSTTLPETVRTVAERLAEHDFRTVDAPVSGGPVGAENGTLTILAAGRDADLDRIDPVFRAMGRNIFRCGALGAGQTVKLVNNFIAITNIYAVNEAYSLAEAAGIDLDVLGPILEVSTGRTFLSEDIGKARRQYATWAADRAAFDATTAITNKDMTLVAKLAAASNLEFPALSEVLKLTADRSDEVFRRWQEIGRGRQK
ncbi:MAG TPA: NAD(P)-dependent oxidoreductase [Hyphomicrobiaceae bacterium]|nr:NAD(P)-dependent oxidoreductase [Hyphomicrobiaceae bacterium]